MYMFLLGVLFGSGLVLAAQELRRQVKARMDEWVQAETDRRMQSLADLKPSNTSRLSEYDARWAGDNGATIVSTPDDQW